MQFLLYVGLPWDSTSRHLSTTLHWLPICSSVGGVIFLRTVDWFHENKTINCCFILRILQLLVTQNWYSLIQQRTDFPYDRLPVSRVPGWCCRGPAPPWSASSLLNTFAFVLVPLSLNFTPACQEVHKKGTRAKQCPVFFRLTQERKALRQLTVHSPKSSCPGQSQVAMSGSEKSWNGDNFSWAHCCPEENIRGGRCILEWQLSAVVTLRPRKDRAPPSHIRMKQRSSCRWFVVSKDISCVSFGSLWKAAGHWVYSCLSKVFLEDLE